MKSMILSWILLSGIVWQLGIDSLAAEEKKTFQSQFQRDDSPLLIDVAASYTGGQTVGFHSDYQELDLFLVPSHFLRPWIPFADLRVFHLNKGDWATDAGIGLRMKYANPDLIFGANIYYDDRQLWNGHLRRLGAGMEILGTILDFRMNAYVPLTGMQKGRLHVYHYLAGYIETCQVTERILQGSEAEIGGFLLKEPHYFLYSALGPYYYHTRSSHIFGGQFRIVVNLENYFTMEGDITYDPVFSTRHQLKIGVNMPLYEFGKAAVSIDPMLQPVRRSFMISTKNECINTRNW